MEWLWAGIAILSGFVVGTVVSKGVKRTLDRRGGQLAEFGSAAASLVFSLVLVAGLLVALGFVQPESLEKLRDDTIDYLPRVLSALIVVILGGVVGTIASTAARESLGRSLGRLGDQIPKLIKAIITLFAAILAASQLGIDTTVINIVVAAVVAGLALAFALIVGFGSRPVAAEIASGRALRRLLSPGDSIEGPLATGRVVAMHPTAVEVDQAGSLALVPNSLLAESSFSIHRADPASSDGGSDADSSD